MLFPSLPLRRAARSSPLALFNWFHTDGYTPTDTDRRHLFTLPLKASRVSPFCATFSATGKIHVISGYHADIPVMRGTGACHFNPPCVGKGIVDILTMLYPNLYCRYCRVFRKANWANLIEKIGPILVSLMGHCRGWFVWGVSRMSISATLADRNPWKSCTTKSSYVLCYDC
jgi:hypothetical protein